MADSLHRGFSAGDGRVGGFRFVRGESVAGENGRQVACNHTRRARGCQGFRPPPPLQPDTTRGSIGVPTHGCNRGKSSLRISASVRFQFSCAQSPVVNAVMECGTAETCFEVVVGDPFERTITEPHAAGLQWVRSGKDAVDRDATRVADLPQRVAEVVRQRHVAAFEQFEHLWNRRRENQSVCGNDFLRLVEQRAGVNPPAVFDAFEPFHERCDRMKAHASPRAAPPVTEKVVRAFRRWP